MSIPVYQWYEIPPNTPGDISDEDEELSAFDNYTEEESLLWDRLFGSIILSPVDLLMMNLINNEPINEEPSNNDSPINEEPSNNDSPTNEEPIGEYINIPENEEEIYPDDPSYISGEYASQEFNPEFDMMWPMDIEEDI